MIQNIFLNGVDIRVETFDLSPIGESHKLDLLFYNNINRYGEILSSLVFNSGLRDASDNSTMLYNPNKLFLNNDFEKSYIISGTNNRWKNADLLTGGISNLKDNSASATYKYEHFNTSTDYAVDYQNGEHAYDGWYTLYSVGINTYADNDPSVLSGTLRYYNNAVQYALKDSPANIIDWSYLNEIDSDIPIYNLFRENRGNTYSEFNFVATTKIQSLYKKALDNKLDPAWYKKINTLSPKLRTIESAIEFEEYGKAQHMINAITRSLLSLLI